MSLEAGVRTPSALLDFMDTGWERQPVSLPGQNPHVDDADLLFAAMRAASDACTHDPRTADFVVWLNGVKVSFDARYAVTAADASLDGYLRRLQRQLPDAEFTVLLANPHLFEPRLWTRAHQWVDLIAARRGMHNGGADTCAFVGCYRQTPFGVHRGQMSVLTFPVLGEKRFLLWPYRYGYQHTDIQDSLSYAAHLDHAQVLSGSRHDLLYWPADYWHIAEGALKASAAWNIGFWWDRPPLNRALQALLQFAAPTGPNDDPDAKGHVPWDPSVRVGALTAGCAELQRIVDSDAFRDAVAVNALRFASAGGFRDVPPLLAVDDGPLPARLRPTTGIHLGDLQGGQLCIAANGHAAMVENVTASLRARLAALSDGRPVATTADPDEHAVFAFLLGAGALAPATDRSPEEAAPA